MSFRVCLILLCSVVLCSFSFQRLRSVRERVSQDHTPEMLYLPSGKGLELLSFGYRNTLAHVLWFQTNNYFGKHYKSDRNYDWLGHYCRLVITLNPKSKSYYEFCGMMLAWEASRFDESIKIYTQAIEAYPNDWLYYYYRGFVYSFFLRDQQKAKEDFMRSATLPNAHHFVARLAAKQLVAEGNSEDAKQFLKEAIEMAADENTKSILENRLRKIESKEVQ